MACRHRALGPTCRSVGPVTNEEACAWEIEQIKVENTFSTCFRQHTNDIGCNFTRGGEGVSGHQHNEITKLRISASSRGRKVSEMTRINMRHAQSKRHVVQYDLCGNVIESYPSQAEAYRMTGVASSSISLCCRRKAKSSGGFVWRYDGDKFDPKTPAVLTAEHRLKLSEAAKKRNKQ